MLIGVSSSASSSSNSQTASQYNCSVGTLNGSDCTYSATAYTGYSCPGCNGWAVTLGCSSRPLNREIYTCGDPACTAVNTQSGVRCLLVHPNFCTQSYCTYCMPVCTTYTYYGCPSGGNLSGTTCYSTPTIV